LKKKSRQRLRGREWLGGVLLALQHVSSAVTVN
jgi:hypothetical protein